jgi:hypothetical protein
MISHTVFEFEKSLTPFRLIAKNLVVDVLEELNTHIIQRLDATSNLLTKFAYAPSNVLRQAWTTRETHIGGTRGQRDENVRRRQTKHCR